MIKRRFILLVIILLTYNTFAQLTGESVTCLDLNSRFATSEERMNLQPTRKSNVPVWLNTGIGGCLAHCYDNGTIPFRYKGFGANLNLGVTVEWKRFHVQYEALGLACIMQHNIGYGFGIKSQAEFLYHFFDGKRNRLHLWTGGAFLTCIDIKDLPPMMNSSYALSLFNNLLASGMVQYDFAFVDDGTRNLFTAYGKIALPLVGFNIRPGFAYLNNYMEPDNVDDYFTTADSFVKVFSGLNTDLGVYLNLNNGNRIGLSYRWDYLSTGKKGFYRYDGAFHTINLNFMFKLN